MARVVIKTRWGYVGIAATRLGITRVILPMSSREHVEKLIGDAPHDGSEEALALAQEAARALRNYFDGLHDESLRRLPIDLRCIGNVRRRALLKVRDVHIGETITYGEVASSIGLRNGARAVGRAMARNPVPILIPCHRVVRADGSAGGFSFGVEMKMKLLRHESKMKCTGKRHDGHKAH